MLMIRQILHLFRIHDWDNPEDGFFPPQEKHRICKICLKKQQWIPSPLYIAFLTDQPIGRWISI
jgi:hypothetical protein